MRKATINIIHASNCEIEIITEASIYAPKDTVYIVPEKDSFIKMAATLYATEKEKNEWIRKYDNVLKGLRYWQAKAKDER